MKNFFHLNEIYIFDDIFDADSNSNNIIERYITLNIKYDILSDDYM